MPAVAATQPAETVEPFAGRILDADGHMYMTPEVLEEITREVGVGPNLDFYKQHYLSAEFRDNRAKNRAELWSVKGLGALGAYDAEERVEALDRMGIKAQLLFPNSGGVENRAHSRDALRVCERFNDYAIDFTQRTKGRAVGVCEINMSDVDWAIAEAKRVVKKGARAVTLPCNAPPGGVSCAHSKWDPFWAVLEEADVPATLHLGSSGLISSRENGDFMFPEWAWGEAETLRNRPAMRAGGEEAISPYFMLVAHIGPEVFLQTMVMGKVFERFPKLRFGIIELSAAWVGPAVERMDLWADFMNKVGVKYSMKPSEYVRRNVRVTPFWHENLPQIIDRYGLEEVWVFSTDYPHLEGSRDPIGKFRKHLGRIDKPGYDAAFFVDNGKLLFPGV
jgi:predicted TIM-barrel fold metal-dependent hydrolase